MIAHKEGQLFKMEELNLCKIADLIKMTVGVWVIL